MEVIADLHLHSRYSRAVSQQMVIPEIARWAKKKGIGLVGAPDWTHPLWLRELKNELIEVGEGVYACKSDPAGPKFLLVTEIASIYSQGNQPRRIHHLVFAPDFRVVEKINEALRNRGVNLLSDGRPITNLTASELMELVLSLDKNCLIISAHAWTPWFSLYGSRSGFDSIKECYQDWSQFLYAIETGLSSDPVMNWRIKELDQRQIVSFSDAHSPAKLGREATVFKMQNGNSKFKISSRDIIEAIKGGGDWQIAYTIEFYPQEGKYHYTGHRNCGVCQSPEETAKLGSICPVCGKKLTVGVMHRVNELAGRKIKEEELEVKNDQFGVKYISYQKRPSYVMLMPLMEILAEALETGVSSQSVIFEYNRLTEEFGSEFQVLLKTKVEEIARLAGKKVAEGIAKVRKGELVIEPGYDGVFGMVKIWANTAEPAPDKEKQMSLF